MKINLMANDEILLNSLKESGLFDETLNIFNKEELTAECIVISDEFLPYKELNEFSFNKKQTVFYMLHNDYEVGLEKNIKAICDSKEIYLIPPRLTTEQVVKEIISVFNKNVEEQSNVISFFSTVSNIGTTSTCLSVAKALSENTKAKIGVLSLNAWDHGTHQIDYKGEWLDQIKGRLSTETISNKDEFLSLFHMVEKDSLYVLGGNRYTKLERLYSKEEIQHLIQLSKKYFDVVLVDSGAHFDNANMVQALYESDIRFLVLNQQTKTIDSFNRIYDEVLYPLGYKRTDFIGIVNRFVDKTQYPSPKSISNELDLLIISTIYEVEDGLLTETENKFLYSYDEPVYKESIMRIVKSIVSHASLDLSETHESKKKKRWFALT